MEMGVFRGDAKGDHQIPQILVSPALNNASAENLTPGHEHVNLRRTDPLTGLPPSTLFFTSTPGQPLPTITATFIASSNPASPPDPITQNRSPPNITTIASTSSFSTSSVATASSSTSSEPIFVILGIAFGGLFMIIAFLIILVTKCRRRKSAPGKRKLDAKSSGTWHPWQRMSDRRRAHPFDEEAVVPPPRNLEKVMLASAASLSSAENETISESSTSMRQFDEGSRVILSQPVAAALRVNKAKHGQEPAIIEVPRRAEDGGVRLGGGPPPAVVYRQVELPPEYRQY